MIPQFAPRHRRRAGLSLLPRVNAAVPAKGGFQDCRGKDRFAFGP